jgi:hypothetical protein
MADENTPDETPTDESATVDESTDTSAAPDLGGAGKKALDAERSRAKEAERKWKAAERELEKVRTASLSDQERAVAEAKLAGRQEAVAEAGKRLARAEIRAAAANAGLKVGDDDLDDLDLSKFVGEDGEPDPTAISARIKRWQALAPAAESSRPRGSIDQGSRGSSPTQSNAEAFAQFLQSQMRASSQ